MRWCIGMVKPLPIEQSLDACVEFLQGWASANFKVGDRVRCIDPNYRLVLFKLYTITWVDDQYVSVDSNKETTLYASSCQSQPVQRKPQMKKSVCGPVGGYAYEGTHV